jgi:hypothetical protein
MGKVAQRGRFPSVARLHSPRPHSAWTRRRPNSHCPMSQRALALKKGYTSPWRTGERTSAVVVCAYALKTLASFGIDGGKSPGG